MGAITDVVSSVVNAASKLIPDADARLKLQADAMAQAHEAEMAQLQAQADIIKTEAQGKGWLASNWRPLVMITFTALIVARWMGWSAPGLTQEEALKLWDIVQLGLGGYVIGRSAEKIAPAVAAAMTGGGK